MNIKQIIILALVPMFLSSCREDEVVVLDLKIVNHKFIPEEVKAPAGKRLKLSVYNGDDVIEEFESIELNREKLVPPGKTVNIPLAPLEAGKYNFYGEFHQDTAKGILIVE